MQVRSAVRGTLIVLLAPLFLAAPPVPSAGANQDQVSTIAHTWPAPVVFVLAAPLAAAATLPARARQWRRRQQTATDPDQLADHPADQPADRVSTSSSVSNPAI